MIYNKMHHMLNDQVEKKKRLGNGSRNLNVQAKLMITQPSERSLFEDGGGLIQSSVLSPLSAMRYKKMKLPSLSSPLSNTSESYLNSKILPSSH